jgi:hypothetical protein
VAGQGKNPNHTPIGCFLKEMLDVVGDKFLM